ncbi:MAG: hypothetical protein HOO67_02160 [Candidatus Peribacteraceae bacterium]|nr:hypothetical protein [Candidatus Peribacteraceae bacterium]
MLDGYLFKKHLEDDEEIRMIVHKHWLMGLRFLIWPTVSFLLADALLILRHSQLAAMVGGLWGIASLVWLLRSFFDYYLDAWIITSHGVIDLEWLGWFHRQSSRVLYSDIQGVSTETHGVTGTLLRYGTVSVEKISTGSTIAIDHVSRPRRVESAILQNMEAYLHTKNLKNSKHIEELLSQFVAQHVQEKTLKKNDVIPPASPAPAKRPKASFRSSRVGSSNS